MIAIQFASGANSGDGYLQNEVSLDPVFSHLLRRQREAFNALFYQARHYAHQLPAETVYRFLTETLQPVVLAVAPVLTPDELDQLALKLTVLALDLIGKQMLAPAGPFAMIETAWRTLFAAHPRLLANSPRRAIASISNALVQLCLHPGAHPQRWLQQLIELGDSCQDLGELLILGQVLGWRAGLAHYRSGALALIPKLPQPLQQQLLHGLPIRDWLTSPWCSLGTTGIQIVRTTGGFAGWGDKLFEPPVLAWEGDVLLVSDSQACWCVFADAFGESWFRKHEARQLSEPGTAVGQTQLGPWQISKRGRVEYADCQLELPELAGWRQAQGNSHTLVVVMPESFQIRLLTAKTASQTPA